MQVLHEKKSYALVLVLVSVFWFYSLDLHNQMSQVGFRYTKSKRFQNIIFRITARSKTRFLKKCIIRLLSGSCLHQYCNIDSLLVPWNLYQMVTQNNLRRCEINRRKKFKRLLLIMNKCLNQTELLFSLHACAS